MTLTDLDLAFDNTALAMNATERLCYDDSLSSFWSALPERSDDGALMSSSRSDVTLPKERLSIEPSQSIPRPRTSSSAQRALARSESSKEINLRSLRSRHQA